MTPLKQKISLIRIPFSRLCVVTVSICLVLDDLSRLGSSFKGCFVILYADDILVLSPFVSQLEKLLRVCERQLAWLDMAINFKKSCCIRIDPRCDKTMALFIAKPATVYHG